MIAEESLLFGAYYAYTSGVAALREDFNKIVTQAYFFRKIPEHLGSYVLAVGLSDVIKHIQHCREFTIDDHMIDWFEETSGGDMNDDMLEYLANFDPKFNIWAVPEGTPMFPHEPIILIEGKYIDIQIIEDALLSTMNHQSLVATKTSRMRYACGKRSLVDFGSRRAHGMGAALGGARASYIGGTDGTSLVLAGYKYGVPYIGTVPHSFIQMHQDSDEPFNESEIDAFVHYATTFPHNSILLVDTYNSINGIMNAIAVGKKLRQAGHELKGIRLDSGDMIELSKMARKMLDGAGMHDARIYVSDNIDEFQIVKMLKEGAQVDGFGVGTRLQTGANYNSATGKGGVSALGGVLKLVEVEGEPSMKFTDNIAKSTLPGKQQVWRVHDLREMYFEDYISTWSEVLVGENIRPLLQPIMLDGELSDMVVGRFYNWPTTSKVREYSMGELNKLRRGYRRILLDGSGALQYPVHLSPKLEELRGKLLERYQKEFPDKEEDKSRVQAIDEYMRIIDARTNIEERLIWAIEHKWEDVAGR